MGDLWGGYLQLANTFLHFLHLSRDRTPVCNCHCDESGQSSFRACSGLVREVLTTCLDQATTQTTTSTASIRGSYWNFGWLWILILIFILGLLTGICVIKCLGRSVPEKNPSQLVVVPADQNAVRGRRGVAA